MDENTLSHYGVKGMKWGVRRTPAQLGHDMHTRAKTYIRNTNTPNPKYSKQLRAQDSVYGKRNVKRINRKMNEGKTHKRAEREVLYGKHGADRIEKRISKGQKVSTAELKEMGIATAKGMAMLAPVYAASYAYAMYNTSWGRKAMNSKASDAGAQVASKSRSARYKIQDILHGAHIIDRGDKVSVSDMPIDVMMGLVKRTP